MSNNGYIRLLFEKYLNNSCTPQEEKELLRLLQSAERRSDVERLIDEQLHRNADATPDVAALARVFKKLTLKPTEVKRAPRRYMRFVQIAAAALLVVGLAVGTYYYKQAKDHETVAMSLENDVAPGGNRAMLTLPDGSTIDLSTTQSGIVVGDQLTYTDGTAVLDQHLRHADTEVPASMSIATPNGGTYQVTLPDGTSVWLNAASTLKYPQRFASDQRIVTLEGEAYFEVSHSRNDVPFIVRTPKQDVEVLGTHFNVNAYPDEQTTTTTLLEGQVKILASGAAELLAPGQQAETGPAGISVAEVDLETVIDWKQGDFIFSDENLTTIMRKVARWYDVEVVYENTIPADTYNAHISRNKNLSEILKIIALSGDVKTSIKGNTVHVFHSTNLLKTN